jgi:carboxyl-terminal processing protease
MTDQRMSIDSKLYGIGVQIWVKDKKLLVVSPIDGTPAAKAGLRPLDQITHINHKSTAAMSIQDAADLIRGPQGSTVTLGILRNHQPFDLTLRRQEIKLKSVFTKPVKGHPEIGYVRLASFISETTSTEMQDIINQLKSKKALVIDIRGNYGGLFSNALTISDMLLDHGVIVSMVDRDKSHKFFEAHSGELIRQPVVLLVDGGSASASEILGGALKDNHRATLMGTQTFGKGLVQKITPLSQGAGLNITISRYLTPNGTDIHKKGISPDIKLPSMSEADLIHGRDPQLDAAVSFLTRQFLQSPKVALGET